MITHYDMASCQPIATPEETAPQPATCGADTLACPALQCIEVRQEETAPALPADLATVDAAAFLHRQARHGRPA